MRGGSDDDDDDGDEGRVCGVDAGQVKAATLKSDTVSTNKEIAALQSHA